mmetsp:Transcript_123473/g.227478  ORF Transcript_123473/g.227478 Transcript_123473/m.227478 type:complete len:205 (+) Transcript_123473:483-1097(+)
MLLQLLKRESIYDQTQVARGVFCNGGWRLLCWGCLLGHRLLNSIFRLHDCWLLLGHWKADYSLACHTRALPRVFPQSLWDMEKCASIGSHSLLNKRSIAQQFLTCKLKCMCTTLHCCKNNFFLIPHHIAKMFEKRTIGLYHPQRKSKVVQEHRTNVGERWLAYLLDHRLSKIGVIQERRVSVPECSWSIPCCCSNNLRIIAESH